MTHELHGRVAALLRPQQQALAQHITDRLLVHLPPEQRRLVGADLRDGSVDASSLLLYLIEAIAVDDPTLLVDYLDWATTWLAACGLPQDYARRLLEHAGVVLQQVLPPELHGLLPGYVELGRERAGDRHAAEPAIYPEAPLGALAARYLEALLHGDKDRASRLVLDAAEGGVSVRAIYMQVLQAAQREIGRLVLTNRATIAQEHYCTAATQLVMGQLSSYVFGAERVGRHMVAAAVGGELHDIGIRMVADFFELEGWDSYYLGANTPVQAIVAALRQREADLLALSVTTSFRVTLAAETIEAVRAVVPGTRILVGGYPCLVSPDLWQRLGADGSAQDAEKAVCVAHELLGQQRP